jgi:hypothetical protein
MENLKPPDWAFIVRTAEVFVVKGAVRLGVSSRLKEELDPWLSLKPRSTLLAERTGGRGEAGKFAGRETAIESGG